MRKKLASYYFPNSNEYFFTVVPIVVRTTCVGQPV